MRDFSLILFVFALLPIVVIRPFIGILLYTWVSIMNPHRMTWGIAYDFPFAALIALVTLIGLIFYKNKGKIPWNSISIILLIFTIWMMITTAFAFFPEAAKPQLAKLLKIEFMVFISMLLLQDKDRLRWFIWIIVLSIGIVGVKGGLFTLLTAGQYRVWGPGGFIEGNNEFGLALVMALPLMRYLQLQEKSRWVRLGLMVGIVLCIIAIVGTYSRGALLALVGTAMYLWWKSPKKVIAAVILAIGLSISFAAMPGKWFDRMDTLKNLDLKNLEMDESAMGRIFAWKFAYNIAEDNPIFGGGFGTFDLRLFPKYQPDIEDPRTTTVFRALDAHSIFFKVLGHHGFVGLGLFIALIMAAFSNGRRVIKKTKNIKELTWARQLASMVQVSLFGYVVGGLFLGLSYFDLFYNLLAVMCVLSYVVTKQLSIINSTDEKESMNFESQSLPMHGKHPF